MVNESRPKQAPRGGIDLGGTKIQAVVVGANHAILGEVRRATPTSGGPAAVVAELASALREAASLAKVDVRSLAGVGVGTPGAVDVAKGTVESARNLPGFDGVVPLAPLLAKELGIAAFLGNDVGVALDAEARIGAGADTRSFIGLWWGTGIGGGVMIEGKRWLGRGAAGEIGHTVVKRNGALCPCGRRGCLEAYAGRGAMGIRAEKLAKRGVRTKLFDIMQKKGLDRPTSAVWAKALEGKDPLATRLVDRAVLALGAGLGSAVNLLDVDAIVIGGGLGTRFGEPMAQRIAEAMQPHLFVPERPPSVRIAKLGDLAGAIGASLLAIDSRA
jgi:glucokinase